MRTALNWRAHRSWSQYAAGVAVGLGIGLAWLAYQYDARLMFAAFGIVGLGAFALLFRFPVIGVALIGFLIVSNTTFFLPGIVTPLMLTTLAAALFPKFLRGDTTVRMVPVFKWAVLLFTFSIFSGVWAVGYEQFLVYDLVRTLILMLCVMWVVETPRDFYIVVAATGVGVIVSSSFIIHSMVVLFTGGGDTGSALADKIGVVRFAGTWLDPNIGPISSVPYLVLNLAVLRSKVPVWCRIIAIVAIIFGITTVVLAQSRSAFIGLVIVVIMFVLADKRRWLILTTISLLIAGVLMVIPLDFFGRLGNLFEQHGDSSISERSHIALAALQAGIQHFPIGIGLGNVRYVTPDGAVFLDRALVSHNAYLDTFAELGVIGLTLLLAALTSTFRHTRVRKWRVDPYNFAQNTGIAGATAVTVIIVVNLFNSYSNYSVFWFVLILIATREWVFDLDEVRNLPPALMEPVPRPESNGITG